MFINGRQWLAAPLSYHVFGRWFEDTFSPDDCHVYLCLLVIQLMLGC